MILETTTPTQDAMRDMWEACVSEATSNALDAMPDATKRINRAGGLVLQGQVTMQANGHATIPSQSKLGVMYNVNGTCECEGFAQYGTAWCVHRLARALQIKATRLLKAKLAALDAAAAPEVPEDTPKATSTPQAVPALPEALASCNVYVEVAGRKVQVTLRDTDETRMLARLEKLLQRFPVVA